MATAKKVWYYRKPIVYSNLVLEDHSLLNAFNLKKCTSFFGSVGFLRNEHFQISLVQSRGLIFKVLSIWFESSPAPGPGIEREREREWQNVCPTSDEKKTSQELIWIVPFQITLTLSTFKHCCPKMTQ